MRCMNKDGHATAPGRRLCKACEQQFKDSLALISRSASSLLAVATKQARPGREETTRSAPMPSHAPSPLREDAWELYCQTEQLMRLAAMACGYRLAASIGTSTVALAHAVLKRPVRILTAADAATWANDINAIAERIRRTLEPAKPKTMFGTCPICGSGVWGEPNQPTGICAGCGQQVDRWNVADTLLERLAETEVTGTPAQLSRECARAGIRLPASTIRSWIHKGKLQKDQQGHISLSRLVPLLRERGERR